MAEEVVAGGFWDVREVAKFLAISRSQVYELMAKGELRSSKFGRSRRVPKNEVLRYTLDHMEPVA